MRKILSFCSLALVLTLVPSAGSAKSMTALRVLVEDAEGEPVARASVVLSRLKSNKKKVKVRGESLQLKTSQSGSAPLPPLAQGRYMLQVISQGFQTYGGEIELNEPEQTVTITLRTPQDQYSVHTDQKSP